MALITITAFLSGLVRVAGLGVHGGDQPVRCDLPGDPPPPVRAVGSLGRFHVLPGDQREQTVCFGGLRVHFEGVGGHCCEQGDRVVDQRRYQFLFGILVILGNIWFAGALVVAATRVGGDEVLAGGDIGAVAAD